ncbi:OLC1v1018359C1 [Oldenlandia corymbosa var. corymbosa]|uniref:tRNA pseudouridine(55) synthase n=1 Tax=Oldenlandia corymbosa var. corymbosa TaxID=529605 RepID=A0AAV1EBT1_OLDCO|nr:OLC1v1018359C1 [Oldenlandia corymbosa var. corymbosa]
MSTGEEEVVRELNSNGGAGDEKPQINSSGAAFVDDGLKFVRDAVRELPTPAVKDLLSFGACCGCIFRVFGIYESIYSFPSMPTSSVSSILGEVFGPQVDMKDDVSGENDKLSIPSLLEPKVCSICLGVLDFVYHDEQGILVRKDRASDLAQMIVEAVKQEYQLIDGFSLEVSLPPVVLENEQIVRLYMKKKYGSEEWFQGKSVPGHISVKDALKLAISVPLEISLGVKSNLSNFRIRLEYELSEKSTQTQDTKEITGCKRRKKEGTRNGTDSNNEFIELSKGFTKELVDHGSDDLNLLVKKGNQYFHLAVICYRCPIYIGGRYLKYSRNVSQTCWIIEDERKGEASVEEIVGGNILPFCEGDSYKFHAAGREDIDVRMLGTGRPFLVEIQNARLLPSEVLIKEAEMKINSLDHKLVKVKNLRILDSKGWELMREGEAEKQKQYAALVWISRPLEDGDLQTLFSITDMKISQKTPIRVLHRRSPLAREKVIHWMKVEKIAGSCQYFLLHLCTQAGTYIKEFVHGDLGRTHPSIGSILGCRAEILQLDVTDVKMDCF